MTLLQDAVHDKKFDSRVLERNVARGQASHQEVEKMMKDLPDDSDNADTIDVEALANED